MKLNNIDIDVQKMIVLMEQNDVNAILCGIHSTLPILNLNAIIFGTKFKIKNPDFISEMKNNLIKSNVKFFGTKLSSFVIASLHILGIQKYSGNDTFIRRYT